MREAFDQSIYYGYLIKGDLTGAICYVEQFPDQAELYARFKAIFAREEYRVHEVDPRLNEILTLYQRYYRDAFYLRIGREKAEDRLRMGLSALFGLNAEIALDDIEQSQVAEAFQREGFHFLGGKTGGYYGPYIWRHTQTQAFDVELPDGIQTYTVKLLDGFLSRSWLDYLSFGEIGTGGWTDGDGIINCVRSSYDLNSENFKISLLKHEAQHARDLSAHGKMSSEDLEYRAKLVELIYSRERNLLAQFMREADRHDPGNGHAAASSRIIEGFSRLLGLTFSELANLHTDVIQATAMALYEASNAMNP